jgi:hypothetical protein
MVGVGGLGLGAWALGLGPWGLGLGAWAFRTLCFVPRGTVDTSLKSN